MEGEIGDLSEKIEREFRREGSMKAGSSLGLEGKVFIGEAEVPGEKEGGEAEEVGRKG